MTSGLVVVQAARTAARVRTAALESDRTAVGAREGEGWGVMSDKVRLR
jgi:hypothetical protein